MNLCWHGWFEGWYWPIIKFLPFFSKMRKVMDKSSELINLKVCPLFGDYSLNSFLTLKYISSCEK